MSAIVSEAPLTFSQPEIEIKQLFEIGRAWWFRSKEERTATAALNRELFEAGLHNDERAAVAKVYLAAAEAAFYRGKYPMVPIRPYSPAARWEFRGAMPVGVRPFKQGPILARWSRQ